MFDALAMVTSGISVPETEQTKKRSVEDNTQQVGGSMASKRQKKDEPVVVNDKDASADPPRDFRQLFDEWKRGVVQVRLLCNVLA